MDWLSISGNWVLIPPRPQAILHFLGGAFVATLPHLTYRCLLEELAIKVMQLWRLLLSIT